MSVLVVENKMHVLVICHPYDLLLSRCACFLHRDTTRQLWFLQSPHWSTICACYNCFSRKVLCVYKSWRLEPLAGPMEKETIHMIVDHSSG